MFRIILKKIDMIITKKFLHFLVVLYDSIQYLSIFKKFHCRLEIIEMPLVFLSKRLKEEEKDETKTILEKYSDSVEYTEIPNDSRIDLIVRIKSDILTNQVYRSLNVTFPCLKQMDQKNINPFQFQPRNIGLRNIFLLGKKISLFQIQFSKPIFSLIKSMGGTINESSDLNDADIIITDQKFKTQDFSVPLVSSSWIYAISNQTLETPFDQYLITKENSKPSNLNSKQSSQTQKLPKIAVKSSSSSNSQAITISVVKDKPKFENSCKKENISASSHNIKNKQSKPSKRRNILNCIRPLSQSSQSINDQIKDEICENIPKPVLSDFEKSPLLLKSSKNENKAKADNELKDKNNNDIEYSLEFDVKSKQNVIIDCPDLPVPDEAEKLMQNSPRRISNANSNHTVSPKINEIMQILTKKSHKKHQKSNDNLRSIPSYEELSFLNNFSQIPRDDENEDEFINDVYYDTTKETQELNEQHSTQMDEDELFRMLES